MRWNSAIEQPTAFKVYAVISNGELQLAEFKEFSRGIRAPHWGAPGVTHWVELPEQPSDREIGQIAMRLKLWASEGGSKNQQ